VTVTLDTVAPTLTIDSPVDGDLTNRETVTVEGTVADENLDSVEVNGMPVTVTDGNYSKRILLDDGANEITVVASDLAGNTETKSVTITAKWNAPTIENLQPSANQTVKPGDEVDISFSSDAEGGTASFTVQIPAQGNLLSSTSLPIEEVAPGVYSTTWVVPNITVDGAVIVVELTDAAGNTVRQAADGTITVKGTSDDDEETGGWYYENGKTYYIVDGKKVTGWYEIKSNWYYFDKKGVMQTGMVKVSDDTYYLGDDGIRQSGWVDHKSNRYFFSRDNGTMQYGWISDGGHNYYTDNKGVMQTGMVKVKGDTYYFGDDGIRQSGWVDHNSKRYFFSRDDGTMQYGWISDGGHTYYTNNKGVMQTGKVKINGKTYYFDDEGRLIE
jgi:hypothetical protein